MKIPLSSRLMACAGLVAPGDRVADIGCDHGYLSIYLLTCGIARSVIASDVRQGPLHSALGNAEKFGVREKIEFYLSDGVQKLPQDFDTLLCAGMGGDTMVHILEEAPWLRSCRYRLILQCQSKTPLLRQYLNGQGWCITQEQVLRDGRFLYTVMEVCWQPDRPRLTAAQTYFPPALLEHPGRDTASYYQAVVNRLRLATAHREDPEKQQALQWLLALAGDPNLAFLKEEPQ